MLTLRKLPWRNLKGYTGRAAALVIFAALMAVGIFGGTTLVLGVNRGLETVRSRLGADLMVVPESAKNDLDARSVLLHSEPGYFYMDAGVREEVAAVEGVAQTSPQMFLASAKAGCCSARLQIIGFDPESDFTIQPWIRETTGRPTLGEMDVILGSNITAYDDFRLYDCPLNMAAQFAPTGSTLDNAVYASFDTIRHLIRASVDRNMNKYDDIDPDHVISSVLVRVAPGQDITEVAERIRTQVSGVTVIESASMISGVAASLAGISRTVSIFIAAICALCTLMILLIHSLMINERRREFAALSVAGAAPGLVRSMITKEALVVDLMGGALGIAVSCLVLFPFAGLISQALGAGFIAPPVGSIFLIAAGTLAVTALAGMPAAAVAARRLGRMEADEMLKEGE